MSYNEFADQFLRGLYFETEETGRPMHQASGIIKKYDLNPKPHWISRMADDWEHSYFRRVVRVLNAYSEWAFQISADGFRRVEEAMEAEEIERFLSLSQEVSEIEQVSRSLVPASDRLVSFSDNAPQRKKVNDELEVISNAITASNTLDPEEKSDVNEGLRLAQELVRNSKLFLVGAFRYLVVERLKKAFEKTIEDAFRLVILTALGAISLIILAVM